MDIFTEKKAEDFLEKNNFDIVKRVFVKDKKDLKKAIKKIGFPLVMKISGKNIIHKYKVGGVKMNIINYDSSLSIFKNFEKVKGFEGVMIQKQIKGKGFLLGIKKTPEFEHIIAFGAGGVFTEKIKDVCFRICPIKENDAREMIEEVKYSKNLSLIEKRIIIKYLVKLCDLIKKYPKIKELDINPLIIFKKSALIVDARIVWED
jgi:hypothetical protein